MIGSGHGPQARGDEAEVATAYCGESAILMVAASFYLIRGS
jgi:hypothetical protein